MINLLPYDLKKQTKAARINVVLFRYFIILAIAMGFVALVCTGAYMFLSITKSNNDTQLAELNAKKIAPSSALGQVNTFKSNLATAKNVLDKQIVYSDVVTTLGTILPAGTKLDDFSITDSSFGSLIDLKVRATSADLEPQLLQGFASSTLFSGYSLISNTQEAGSPGYPYMFTIRITLNRTTPR